jgi:Neuralized
MPVVCQCIFAAYWTCRFGARSSRLHCALLRLKSNVRLHVRLLFSTIYVCSGSSVMRDGSTINSNYRLDLDNLRMGSCVGVMRCSDRTLHYYLDGVDQGVACTDVPSGLFVHCDILVRL